MKNLRFYDAFFLLFFLDHNISFTEIGILYASREIITNAFEIPSGIIADFYGRKKSLIGAFALYILSFILFYFSSRFAPLLVAMLLVGIGDAFRSGTHKGMIMDYLRANGWGQHKISYYGHTRSWSQKGSALSALLGGVLVFYSGDYKIIYLVSIVPYLLNFINIYSYPEELNYPLKRNTQERTSLKLLTKTILTTIKKRRVLEIVNSSALHSAFLKSIKDYIQPLLVNIAIVIPIFASLSLKSKSGLIVGVIYFFIFLLTSYTSRMSGRFFSLNISKVEKKTMLLGLILGILCGVLFHYELFIFSVVLFILIYMLENLRKPILTGFLANSVPDEILTSVISVQSFYKTLMTAILSVLIGVLSDYFGIGISLLTISLLLLLLSMVLGNGKRIKGK